MISSTRNSGVAARRAAVQRKETPLIVMRGHRVEFPEKAHRDVPLGFELLLFRQRHLDARENEERAEHVDEPVKALEQAHSGQDEDKAHKRRAHDAPEALDADASPAP
jgi:hypothetical protein